MKKKRILIVDDEPGFIRLLKLLLEKTGRFEVREENNALQALETAVKFKPDLVLLDFIMPKIDGGSVAIQLRDHPKFSQTPILFLSATVGKRGDRPMQISGFPALAKPIGFDGLLEAIEATLSVAAGSEREQNAGWQPS